MKNLLSILCLAAIVGGCSSSTDTPCSGVAELTGPYTISGHLIFAQPMMLPSDAELICYWPATNISIYDTNQFDLSRVFGHGTFDLTSNTFSLTFQGIPPGLDTARDSGTCKMVAAAPAGYILLVSKSLANSVHYKWFDTRALLGAVDSSAMVYLASNTPLHSWMGTFPQGYGIGSDTIFNNGSSMTDSLRPRANSGLSLRIDTTGSSFQKPIFHFPYNWLAQVIQY